MKQGKKSVTDASGKAVDVLMAISEVSAKLAQNLIALSKQGKIERGEKRRESNGRYGRGHRRAAKCGCRYY